MKKVALVAALFVAGSVAMAEDTVSYDFSSAGSSETVHYDTAAASRSDEVVHYDIRDGGQTHQESSKSESR